jgi:hypothetical protein
MTLATTVPMFDYLEDGATLDHPIPFQFENAADIVCSRIDPVQCTETPVALGADFSVSGGRGGTGAVHKASGGTVGLIFRIKRATPRSQPTVYTPDDPFPAESHEDALDRDVRMIQETDVRLGDLEGRAWRMPLLKTGLELTVADVDGVLGVDELGEAAFFPLSEFAKGEKGDPGGNIMAIGLFTEASELAIGAGTNAVQTSGHTITGEGVAIYSYDGAVDAAYVLAHPRTAFISLNGRGFRLCPIDGTITASQAGCRADGATNDQPAAQEGVNLLGELGGGTFKFDKARTYKMSAQLLLDNMPVQLAGAGMSIQPATGCRLKFPAGLSGGVRLKNGANGKGHGIGISNLTLEGSGILAVSDADAQLGIGCGLRIQANSAQVHNVVCTGWEGNGATLLSAWPEADVTINANNSSIDGLHCYSNLKNGFAAYGVDSNNCNFGLIDVASNGQFGIYENSFLGNTYADLHCAGNASGAVRLGNVTRANRITMYKEVSEPLVVQIDAGGGGRNLFDFRQVEGDGGGVVTIIDNSGTGDNRWFMSGVWNVGAFGLGNGNTGFARCDETGISVRKGRAVAWLNDDETKSFSAVQNHAGALVIESPQIANEVNIPHRLTTAGLNVNDDDGIAINDVRVVGPRLPEVFDTPPAAAAPTQAEFNALVDAVNAICARMRATTGHGLISG